MRVFFYGIDKDYLIKSLKDISLIQCKITIDIYKENIYTKRIEYYNWDIKYLSRMIVDELYKENFDYCIVRKFY